MEQILNEYCKQFNPGLLLLSMPTGYGKTYNVLNFIYYNYEEFAAQNRKILFITNLKKNLPINELKERFIADRKEDDFNKHVLFIDSNVDTVVNRLLKFDNEIPDRYKTKDYSKLKSHIEILQNSKLPKEVKDSWETEIRKNIEPKFRQIIKKELDNNFKTKKARLSAIKNDQDYQWIGKLYPAVFTDDKTVFFLSIDKFVAKNTTLVEPSYYFNERLINKPLIFIDEFDTTKEAVLNNIIKSGLQHRVDLLDLFLNIHNHLMPNECPEKLLKESETFKKKSSVKNWLSPRQHIETFREKANHIFTTYKLQHTCKSHEDFSTKQRNFLFYDYEFHYVLDRHKRIALNFRIIHDADFYEKIEQEDEYLPSTDKFQRQHLTIESTINVTEAIVKTIIKEQLIKRDISSRTLNLFDWSKLELKGVWTFVAWDEDENHVIFMEIQPNGSFEFYESEERGIFNWEKFDKYKDAMTDSSSGDKTRTLEGLVISDTGDINQIFRTDEITIPELSKIEAIINEVETEFPENKRSGNALAALIQEFMTESSRKDNEDIVIFSDELQILGSNELDKKSFKKLLNERLGKSSNISSELRNYLLNKHNIRLIFSKQKENLEDLFDASLNIKYFGETEKEAYYFVGDRNVKDYSFNDACHLRKIVAVNESKLIFRQLLQTMDVDFVRTGQSTVIPFAFKYIREYKNFGVAK
ncbi:hypothetical protein [Tolypothrix sp. VBCCA 56010]|uniref:hypothetical protein n=1 Tax=Tolypothrix sp. VBCCA 56010 TaxID=3137731 RepID=UPI003D7D2F44